MTTIPLTVFWFRRDLRLHDNVGLQQALLSGQPVLPIFIFDTHILDVLVQRRDRRVEFIHAALVQLQEQLHQRGKGLEIRIGKPLAVWQELLVKYEITAVYFNHDYEPYAIKRDNEIMALLTGRGIRCTGCKDQVVFEKFEVVKDDGKPYTMYTPYMKKWRSLLRPQNIKTCDSAGLLQNFLPRKAVPVPSMQKLGFKPTHATFPDATLPEDVIYRYEQTRDFPALDATTKLGVHLRFGTVSIRELVRAGMQLSETWVRELIWREFFMQILFHFPHVEHKPFRSAYEAVPWQNDRKLFQQWCVGKTGYPLVDAGMRQLNETGFMHNRVRMVCAGFLAKHLLINWQWGEKYFADRLLDFELAANNGNWQWAAGCGCDSAPYFRVFNPTLQQKRFDPQRSYIKKWVTEVDTTKYPQPMVDHQFARNRAIRSYQEALR